MELEQRKIIVNKYVENPTWSYGKIAKALNLSKSTVGIVIKRFKERLNIERAVQKKRRQGCVDKNLNVKVLRSCKQNPGLSDNDRAKRYGSNRSTVRRIRIKAGLKSYLAIKAPNRTDKQNSSAKKRTRILYDRVLTKFKGCIVMDDETYVKLDLRQLPGRKYYVSNVRASVPAKYKYCFMDKYAKKVMIWQAICSCGLKSAPYVTTENMNSKIYIEECLNKRLNPFIRLHKSPVKFWPDLASCHYSKDVLTWYESNNIDFITKDMNPPNCPMLRPIEKYWAIVKRMLKKNGGYVKDANLLRLKWIQFTGKVTRSDVQGLMRSINRHARNFIHNTEM